MDEVRWHHAVPAGAWPVMARSHELETEYDRGGECECERNTFSWSACDVCGSNLGGARDAVVFWFGPEETSDRSEPEPAPVVPEVPADPGLHTNPQVTCPACAADPGITRRDHFGILAIAASLAADRELADQIEQENS
jgi:hypothetical protein